MVPSLGTALALMVTDDGAAEVPAAGGVPPEPVLADLLAGEELQPAASRAPMVTASTGSDLRRTGRDPAGLNRARCVLVRGRDGCNKANAHVCNRSASPLGSGDVMTCSSMVGRIRAD